MPQMIQWYRESKFAIDKLVKYYPVGTLSSLDQGRKGSLTSVLMCVQVEEFETAVADMNSGATVKPVLIW